MTKLSLIKKIMSWYGFTFCDSDEMICIQEIGTMSSYTFKNIEEALKSFYDVMIITNNNLKACRYQIWSDEELSFIASL